MWLLFPNSSRIKRDLYATWMTVIAIVIACFAFVGAVVVFREYKRKERNGNYSKLLDDLTE